VSFQDRNGNALSEYTDDIFILNQGEMEKARASVAAYRAQEALVASLPNLEIRFEWFETFYKKPKYEDISALSGWWEDIVSLMARLERREPAVFDKNTVKRYAHRSAIDNTLQPHSVWLRETFDADTSYPLMVALHGSGVEEQGWIQSMVTGFGALGYPIAAPKGRGLSDGYAGDSGKDVLECIEHFFGLFPNIRRDRIFLVGHSMGGYGTWCLGLRNPGYFRGLIVASGTVQGQAENVLGWIEQLKEENILVIHGAKDLTVPVEGTRQAVEKLKAMNANVEYLELPEAGHGDYGPDVVAAVSAWIQKYAE
jgi:predicted peptidase